MKKHILVYLSPSNLLLNALMLVASTAPWSNWFHLLITLLEQMSSTKSAYNCVQLQYTIQHWTVLTISPLTSRQTS